MVNYAGGRRRFAGSEKSLQFTGTEVGAAFRPFRMDGSGVQSAIMAPEPVKPRIGPDTFVAESAYVGGDVEIGAGCAIMHQVVIRGDIAPIRIGPRTNVQDGTVMHTRYGVPLEVAAEVVIGHRAVVHCRSVGTRSLIGIGSVVLDDAKVGEHCIIAAGAVVLPGTRVPDGALFAGVPARRIRDVTDRDRAEIDRILGVYRDLAVKYAAGAFPNTKGPGG